MKTLDLVKITDTSGKVTGTPGQVTYQALTDDELDVLYMMESGYSYFFQAFTVERLGEVQVPSFPEQE